MYEKGSSRTQRDIEALSGTTMCGEMIEETDESVTIKTGNSLFEIPREFVKKVSSSFVVFRLINCFLLILAEGVCLR